MGKPLSMKRDVTITLITTLSVLISIDVTLNSRLLITRFYLFKLITMPDYLQTPPAGTGAYPQSPNFEQQSRTQRSGRILKQPEKVTLLVDIWVFNENVAVGTFSTSMCMPC